MLRARWAGIFLFVPLIAGCSRVQRTFSINSEPPGALLVMNDQEVGRTPVTRDFVWYGWYDVILRKEGYKTLKTRARIIAPPWQWPPFDLLAEFSPARLKDRHDLLFKLQPADEPPGNEDMLSRAEQMRLQLESSQYTKNPSTRAVTQPATTQSTQPATTQSTQPSSGPATVPLETAPPPTTQPATQKGFL